MSSTMTDLPERNLDVLRTVAVSCVLVDHFGLVLTPPGSSRLIWAQIGEAGVLLFFVHTALVLMASLERQGHVPNWMRNFYVRRAFRIYPLAMATVLLVWLTQMPGSIPKRGVHADIQHISRLRLGANFLLVQNVLGLGDVLGPLWSLPLEVDMYLLLPFCFLAAQRSWRTMGVMAAALLAGYAFVHSPAPGAWRLTVFDYGFCFFGGVLAYHLLTGGKRASLPAWTLAVVLLVAVGSLPVMHSTGGTHIRNWIPCLFVGACLPFIRDAAVSPLTRVAHTIAKYSYGVYLLHVPVMRFAFDTESAMPLAAQIAISVFGIVAVPWFAYHLIEKRGIRLGQYIVQRPLTLAAVQPAP